MFFDVLTAAGLTVVPRWVVHGDYTRYSGADAALCRDLEAHPDKPRFQAIVAANDSMALGVQDY